MTVGFAPWVPWWMLALASVPVIALLLVRRPLSRWRALSLVLLVAALTGPRITQAIRHPVNDVALVVVDDSASQAIGQRRQRTEQALTRLQDALQHQPHLDVRTLRVGGNAALSDGTQLFQALESALADIPPARRAGVIVLTDGIVHDRLKTAIGAPLHVLLTGEHHEIDRRVEIVGNPDFALVGKDAPLKFRLYGEQPLLPVTVQVDGVTLIEQSLPTGRDITIDVPIRHSGQTVVDVAVAPVPGELTLTNNHAIVGLSGVRDRLKVLLLSGVPHVGERMWRNLLKADPGIDLIHFTILRSPDKADPTPLNELALIAFPVRELFETRLPDFDLVILDRYRGGELPPAYLTRLNDYVRSGGALLLVAGPEFTPDSALAQSSLTASLPALPTGPIINTAIRPTLSAEGLRHPVTSPFAAQQSEWGRWLGHVPVRLSDATAPLVTETRDPLLVLSHADQGRVAEILSDTGWLWARGWENGGPYRELLRRTVHWLMKEPQLEEESLTARLQNGGLFITRRSLTPLPPELTVTAPDGSSQTVTPTDHGDGSQTAQLAAAQPGLWRISDGSHTAIAVDGDPSPLELAETITTDRFLQPAVSASGGHLSWLADRDSLPTIRRTSPTAAQSGPDWMGLIQRNDTVITGLTQSTAWPSLTLIGLGMAILLLAWWREAR